MVNIFNQGYVLHSEINNREASTETKIGRLDFRLGKCSIKGRKNGLHVGDNESERLARKIKMRRDRVMFGKVRV